MNYEMVIKHAFRKMGWVPKEKVKGCGSDCLREAGLGSGTWSVKAWLFL